MLHGDGCCIRISDELHGAMEYGSCGPGGGGAADGCAVVSCRSVCSLSPAALGRIDGRRSEEEEKTRQKLKEDNGAAHLQPGETTAPPSSPPPSPPTLPFLLLHLLLLLPSRGHSSVLGKSFCLHAARPAEAQMMFLSEVLLLTQSLAMIGCCRCQLPRRRRGGSPPFLVRL